MGLHVTAPARIVRVTLTTASIIELLPTYTIHGQWSVGQLLSNVYLIKYRFGMDFVLFCTCSPYDIYYNKSVIGCWFSGEKQRNLMVKENTYQIFPALCSKLFRPPQRET